VDQSTALRAQAVLVLSAPPAGRLAPSQLAAAVVVLAGGCQGRCLASGLYRVIRCASFRRRAARISGERRVNGG
jgi:hypothetical protein